MANDGDSEHHQQRCGPTIISAGIGRWRGGLVVVYQEVDEAPPSNDGSLSCFSTSALPICNGTIGLVKTLLSKFLPSWFTRVGEASEPRSHAMARGDAPAFLWDVPRYPPFDDGLPVIASEALMASQREIADRIYQALGLSPEHHSQLALPVLHAFASYAQLLPATRDAHYPGAGGLLRLGLETAAFALRRSESIAFSPHETGEMRRRLEPVWRFGVFVGGLLNPLWAITETMTVTTAAGVAWSPYTRSLEAWAKAQAVTRVFVNQRPHAAGVSRASTATLANRILTPEALEYLTSEGPRVLSALMGAISGSARPADHNVIDSIVAPTLATLIERDLAAAPHRFGKPVVGMHLEPYLVDAMVRALQRGIWRPNVEMGRVMVLEQGTFLLWPLAGSDLRRQLADLGVRGVPETDEALLRLLVGSGVVASHREFNGAEVLLHPVIVEGKRVMAVKLLEPRVLWPDSLPDKHPAAALETPVPRAASGGLPTLGSEPAAAAQANASSTPLSEIALPASQSTAAGAGESASNAPKAVPPRLATPARPRVATTPDAAPGVQKTTHDTASREDLKIAIGELAGAVNGRIGRRALVTLMRRAEGGDFKGKKCAEIGVVQRQEVLIVAERLLRLDGLDWETVVSDLAAGNILRAVDADQSKYTFAWPFGSQKEAAVALRTEFLHFWTAFAEACA